MQMGTKRLHRHGVYVTNEGGSASPGQSVGHHQSQTTRSPRHHRPLRIQTDAHTDSVSGRVVSVSRSLRRRFR